MRRLRSSAQRLSASQRWASREHAVGIGDVVVCSTPFGITEVGMHGSLVRSTCRTCRCSTPFGITEVGTVRCRVHADRLADGAQRLSASQRWASRDRRRSRAGIARVLNAFRHHRGGHRCHGTACDADASWCSTPFGITEVGIDSSIATSAIALDVLNAFRHHRGGHRPLPNPFHETPCAGGFQGRCRKPAKSGRAWACPTQAHGSILPGNGS